ncbi:MAG: hypothetical protein C5B57_10120 [Blastocatellia bacterium]|nr:MAG: hypothetical protein C5B57_10120 [Blastocatellia bacterium]
MIEPTPLLDFFKRGEVARDVRLLAAEGRIAPRAHEQLAILVLLLKDSDPEVRRTADQTLNRIPMEALKGSLAQSDVPIGLREFFAERGISPGQVPSPGAVDADGPLLDAGGDVKGLDTEENQGDKTVVQRLAEMGFTDRLKAAMKGTREVRAILIRDPNKMIAAAVLSSPKVTESEVESFARMANVSEEVLRTIGQRRSWMKNYGIVAALTKNPKTPLAVSLNLMPRLNDRDVNLLSVDRNVPEPLRIAARKRVSAGTSKR